MAFYFAFFVCENVAGFYASHKFSVAEYFCGRAVLGSGDFIGEFEDTVLHDFTGSERVFSVDDGDLVSKFVER